MKSNHRKEELLETAYKLFITRGYENTSVDEIISQVGIVKGTYYYYFTSKEEMLEQVIERMIAKEITQANQILTSKISVPNKIVNIIFSIRPTDEEEKFTSVLNKPENTFMHQKVKQKIIQEVTPLLVKVVEEGIKQNIFSCDNIAERIKMLLIVSNELFDDQITTIEMVEVFIDTIEKVLGAPKGTMTFLKQLLN